MSATAQLFVIRHGETEWSLSGRHTSHTDLALTPHGEDQARLSGAYLRTFPVDRVLTSPRQRARRTAELAGLGVPVTIDPDLAEWDYGDYEGRTSKDIDAERPGWRLFRDGCPGGETPQQVCDRADRLIAGVRETAGNVAVFSHGHFGCVLGARWIGLPILDAQHLTLSPASLSVLGYASSHRDVPVITQWNRAP